MNMLEWDDVCDVYGFNLEFMMRILRVLFWAIVALGCGLQGPASALQGDTENGIGYTSVATALHALKARNDVRISVQGGWTIVNDPIDKTAWSFAPPDHPAFPAAVKRTIVERNGAVLIHMRVLCQAAKPACDKLTAEFQELNEKVRSNVQLAGKTSSAQWSPSHQQEVDALAVVSGFQRATDEARFHDAYEMFTLGMKNTMPFERFAAMESQFLSQYGGAPVRTDTRTTWYKDPPNASAPGVFAAFNIRCSSQKIEVCEEVMILHEERDGKFRVMRLERNIMDKKN